MEMMEKYVRLAFILGTVAVLCGTAGAGMGIVAETQAVSAGNYPVCTSPCECITESDAAQRWGAEGYEMCSKSICGQTADAMIQYYCIHPIGGTSSPAVTTCQAPCECLSDAGARSRWGTNGYTQCSKTTCGDETTGTGTVARYCYRQFGSTLLIGGTAAATATTAAAITPAAVQTQPPVQAAVTGTAAPVTPSPSYTWPSAGATPQQKTPVGIPTILAALGTALLAAVAIRRG